MASFIKSDTHITLVFDDGNSETVYSTNQNYAAVCTAVKEKDWEKAELLAKPVEAVKILIKGIDKVAVESGCITYDGTPLHNSLTKRMLQMHDEGFDIQPLALFLENLMDNPSYRAVNELYGFLENSDLPITEDGHFLAYKRIGEDFKDLHTRKLDNSIGSVVEMRRNTVDEDKNRTCSSGLHFCARRYLPSFGSHSSENKVIMVKINPRDVVAIPTDYNNAKGRTCRYQVVKELEVEKTDDQGYMPIEIEGAFIDTTVEPTVINNKVIVDPFMIEKLNLAETLLGDGEPSILDIFESATVAMHQLDIDSSSITKVCNGTRRSAGGFAWRWASDNPKNCLPMSVEQSVEKSDED